MSAKPASPTIRRIERAPSAYSNPLLLKHLLLSGVRQSPKQEIVYRDLKRMTYSKLAERVARLANALLGLGVTAGQTVAVLDWDSNRYLESYFAIPGMGAVLHMVNIRLSQEQILYTINHARDDVLLIHTDFLPLIEEIWGRIDPAVKVLLLTDADPVPSTDLPIAGEYEQLIAAASPAFDFPDFDEDACATTFYTTGTTGLPKGVSFSHRQIVMHSLGVATALGTAAVQGRLHRDDVYMPLTPMFHVHAWGLPFIATMLGVKQVYPGRYEPEMICRLHQIERVTISHGVPTLLQMILSAAPASADLKGWKFIVGGSSLSGGLAKAALDRGMDVFTGYGMSETCPIISLAHVDTALLEANESEQIAVRTKTGRPLPLVDLRVLNDELGEVAHDGASAGEIVVRSPWATQAYVGDPANSEKLWQGGFLHTGDSATIDADGYVRITDRIKDVIKSGGEWVSSLEIEDLISRHFDVAEVAVVGVPDARWGERPIALIVAKPGVSVTKEMIVEHLKPFCDRGIIAVWAIPERVLQVEALEKTSVGKLDKKLLRQKYAQVQQSVGDLDRLGTQLS